MYSIGEFSKINRITPKTLRHYDRIGLIRPQKVDQWTGYRYYAAEQLPEIRRILELKALGFTLEEIRQIKQGREEVSLIVQRQEQRLKEQLEETKVQIEKIRDFLRELEGATHMKTTIQIKGLPEVVVASMRTTVADYDSYFEVVPKMGEYMKRVGAVCRDPEYCFTIYHDGEYREHDIDVEICEAVTAPCRDSDTVTFKTIPEVRTAACIEHLGPYGTLRESYNALFTWVEENGYSVTGNPRESYIDGIWNQEDPAAWLTEIQLPVERRAEGSE